MLPDYEYVNLEDETTRISAIDDMGQYVLSGSQNFLMEKRIRPISGGARGHASTAAPLV